MFVSLMPVSAIAAWVSEDALYLQMLELGLVDQNGDLIEDSSFTLQDGTRLSSLSELVSWLHSLDEQDFDLSVSVDASGKTATALQLMQVLNLEYQIADVSQQLNLLASGTSAVQSEEPTLHDIKLAMNAYVMNSTFYVSVFLTDEAGNLFQPSDGSSIPIELGLFSDVWLDDTSTSDSIFGGVGVKNGYRTIVLNSENGYTVSLSQNLSDLRKQSSFQNKLTWAGNEQILLEVRTAQEQYGEQCILPSQSVSCQLTMSREDFAKVDGSTEYEAAANQEMTVAGWSNNSVVPYKANPSYTKTTKSSKEYFQFTLDNIVVKNYDDFSQYGDTAVCWEYWFRDLINAGMGDSGDQRLVVQEMAILVKKKASSNKVNAVNLYAADENGDLTVAATGKVYSGSELSTLEIGRYGYYGYLANLSIISGGNFTNLDRDLENKLKSEEWQLIRFTNVEIPIWLNSGLLEYSTDFYLPVDYIQQDDKNSITPDSVMMLGIMQLKDTTAPTVKSIQPLSQDTYDIYYPGDIVPIAVTFSEPVQGDFELLYLDGTDIQALSAESPNVDTDLTGDLTSSDTLLSDTRVFYYTVSDTDANGIRIVGLRPTNTNVATSGKCCDARLDYLNATSTSYAFLNVIKTDATDSTYGNYISKNTTLLENSICGMRPQDSIGTLTAQLSAPAEGEMQNPNAFTVQVSLSNDTAFKQAWANLGQSGRFSDVQAYIVVDGDTDSMTDHPLLCKNNTLVCDLMLDEVSADTPHTLELWLSTIGSDGGIYYGTYATITQQATVYPDETAYTITLPNGWPSQVDNTVYAGNNEAPVFAAQDNGQSFTYKKNTLVEWRLTAGENVVRLKPASGTGDDFTLASSPAVTIEAIGEGEATLQLYATGGGKDLPVSAPVRFTVIQSDTPYISASTTYARQGTDVVVTFSSNLYKHEQAENGDLTAALFELDEAGNVTGDALYVDYPDWTASSVTIPGEYLQKISQNDAPICALRLRAVVQVDASTVKEIITDAPIVVRSQPASITLSGLDDVYFMGNDTVNLGWAVDNFDLENNPDDCAFELKITKDGETVYETTEKRASGSYSLHLDEPDGLSESYLISVKAKNGADPTWSRAAATIIVYRNHALDILVGGESRDSVTLGNTISETGTTTSPTITNYNGETYRGLNTAQDIAELRTQLGLMESVSINYSDYNWSTDDDRICWSTSTGQGTAIHDAFERAVTINYREGLNYAPLENYAYTSYIPEVLLTLCGINNGTNLVTATHHVLSELTDTITVNVERLQNKLYLFQFTPAVTTEVSYTDGLGVQHTVYSNDDGSLALFEPNGIASEVCTASISGGEAYRGTLSRYALKSGEGNGIYGEIYPLNALELRRAAVAEVQLLKPDGTPLSNTDVTLRGGVYRNRYAAENRDDAYCANAMFAMFPQQAATLDGKQDQIFTTDENGVLTVHMDLQQFTSENDPDPVGVGDSLEFIFELRFANDAYQPELIIVDSSLTKRDALRSGEDIVTLTETSSARPFVAVQTVSYTGRQIDVRNYTGVVGPSSTYPEARLETMLMLWGDNHASLSDSGYTMDLREQNTGLSLPEQKVYSPIDASFPFSSIPLVSETVMLNSDSFVNYTASKKTPMEAAIYESEGNLLCTIPLAFGLVDLTAIEKVQDAPSLVALMTNLAIYGSVGGANTEYGLVNSVSDIFLKDGLSMLEKLGGEVGLLKAVLTPTEDPTRYDAYLWTGLNTTKLGDLDYDQSGIAIEPSYIGQDNDSLLGQVNDTFTLSDFQAMADGSYFDDRGSLYGAVSQGVLALPVMLQLEGWVSTEIRYNFDKGEWEVLTTGGGFTAGVQLEFEKAVNGTPYGIPLTASFKIRGGAVVDFQTAIRYAQQLGMEWNDETASRVNDYLTALRLNAYFEFFAGVGHDHGFTAKLGAFGSLEINNENRFLTRNYLKNPADRSLDGQFLQLDGEVGIRAALGVGPLVSEWTMVSIGFSNATFSFNSWSDISEYWEEASSGLGDTGWDYENGGTNLSSFSAESGLLISQPVVKTQSRDYLENANRQWLGDNMGVATLSLDDHCTVSALETNSYPYANPMLSDDGSILVYLSDADSTDLNDIEVRYSLSDGGTFPDGSAIPAGSDSFSGYGDSSLDFAGTADFAGAVWLREGQTLDLKPDVAVSEEQQIALLRGLEVTASIWDGDSWNTTRLTDNDTQELEPIIAVNENNQAIVVWRSVQFTDSIFSFDENRIFCKIYDNGTWSDACLLYNGSTGNVTGMDVALLENGTAAIAYSLENDDAGEIYYTMLDIASDSPEDNARTLRASTNSWNDENPRIIAVDEGFVLGWVSAQNGSGAEQTDLSLRLLDNTGAPQSGFPASLSQLITGASFDGQFTFVKGASSLDALSILWNDANAGEQDNDVLRAIKLGMYNGSYGTSAPLEVAELPANTSLDHVDACITSYDGTGLQAVLQGLTLDTEHGTTQPYTYTTSFDGKTETHTVNITIPKETTNLYSASANYADAIEVTGIQVDFSTLTTDSIAPVTFTITNQGMNVLDNATISVGGQTQTVSGLALLPGQSRNVSIALHTGSVIEDLPYTVKASFDRGQTASESGTLYLDYPDVGISALTVTYEQDGIRTVLANLYNQSAASLNKPNRRVVLGVYSDPECETPVDGSFFADGTSGQPYTRILSGDTLSALDVSGSTQSFTFHIGAYVDEAEGNLTEIPDSGITLFVKAQIEQLADGQWLVLPEADALNNQKHITFDSLLTRSGSLPVTSSVMLENGRTTTAYISLQNNSLCENTTGYLVAALLDDSGDLLETQNLGTLSLAREEVQLRTVSFSKLGTRVVLRYAEPVSDDSSNANVLNITIDGTALSIDSFDAEHQAKMTNVAPGQYLLIVTPEDVNATVTVNHRRTSNGMFSLTAGYGDAVFSIQITSADGTVTNTYVLTMEAMPKTQEPTTPAPVGPSVPAVEEPDTPENPDNPENPFADVFETDWFYEDVLYAYENALMNGTGNDLFSPNGITTRGMLVTILHRLAGTPEPVGSNPFTDVSAGSYCESAVVWASENGIVNGYGNGNFGPNDPITREQMAAILYRFAAYQGTDVSVGEDTNILSFDDAFEVSEYAMPAMQWACGTGLINGTSDTTLSPRDSASRAQTAAILHRFREKYLR